MARVVKVELLLEAARYIRGAREAEKATDDLADGIDDVGRTSDKTTKSTEQLGGGLDHLARDARRLDSEIAKSKTGLRDLAREISNTSDASKRVDLAKQLGLEQRGHRKLVKLRDLIDFEDNGAADAARGFTTSFAKELGPLLARIPLGPVGAAIAGGLAVVLVPTLGAAIAGAVVGGVGVGGVVGGIALAAKDSRVQDAGKHLGDAVMGDLESSATRFVAPTIRGIQIIEGAWHDVSDTVDDVFGSTSRYVEPLARGLAGAVREIAPGLREAAAAAGPIVDVIGEELPELGAALGDMFSDFADHADEGATALRYLFMLMETGIDATSAVVTTLADMFRVLVNVGDAAGAVADIMWGWLPVAGDQISQGRDKIAELKAGLDDSGDAGGEAGDKIQGGLRKAEEGAAAAKIQVRSLQEVLDDFTDATLDARQANRQFEQAVDDAAASVKQNGRTLDDHTEKGRKNQEALDAIARATIRQRDATLKTTGSQEQANAVTERGRAAFLKAADAMGMEAAKAKALADKLFAIPNVSRTVGVNNKQALAAIARVQSGINGLHGKDLHVGVYYTTKGDLKLPGGTSLKGIDRWGGMHVPMAAGGIVTRAGIYPASNPPLIQFAEPETGGEAYIPRRGDLARSRAIWSHVGENWLGMRPAMQSGGGTTVVRNLTVTVNVPATVNRAEVGREVVEAVRAYEQSSGKGWRS